MAINWRNFPQWCSDVAKEATYKKCTTDFLIDWELKQRQMEIYRLKEENSRLLVLATKHCPKDHYDWAEILEIAKND